LALKRRTACALLLSATQGIAQRPVATADTSDARNAIEVWAGYSPTSTNLGELGRHAHLSFGLVGVRFNRRLSTGASRVVDYTFDMIPYARVAPLVSYDAAGARVISGGPACEIEGYACRWYGSAAGAGIAPLGFTVVRRADRAVQVRYGLNGGALIFDRPTPSDLATRFNFTASGEIGIQVMSKQRPGFLVVYRMHHLSNAGRGNDNLALLSHVFSAGFRWP
jgi:hypothetical protein